MVAPHRRKTDMEPWDEEHVKALLRFPRFPIRLLQQEPWQSWISQRGGLKAVYDYLKEYPLPPSHRRILDVVLSNPESVSHVYADRLHISRATYFYQLRQLIPVLVQALNEWQSESKSASLNANESIFPLRPVLPVPVTSLVGAERLLQALEGCLQREDVHLLTLLGPGGIGKTRLAIEIAHRLREHFNDQICFVDLSTLREPSAVATLIAQSLGLKQTSVEALKHYLRHRSFLLILDNFEHLLPARTLIAELLSTAPRLKILVTSRASLHLYGEHELVVPPLPLPSEGQDAESAARSPAVLLFVQRAQEVNPAFALTKENLSAIIELCRQMEGIPLAIEWVAFQAKYFSPQALLVRLANTPRIEFLSQTPKRLLPSHQQTMRHLLDWSYNLLSDELKTLLNRLAVFPDSFTLEAAEAVCNLPASFDVAGGLVTLIDQSLLTQEATAPSEETRFHMSGFLREYALEKLRSKEEVRSYYHAHANYYLHLAEIFASSPETGDLEATIAQLNREYTNLRAAIQWAIEEEKTELALRFTVAIWDYWRNWGNPQEGRLFTQRALEHSNNLSSIRAQALRQIGWLACDWGDATTMLWAFQNSLEIAEALQDQAGIGLALQGLGELARLQGHWKLARAHFQKCLAIFNKLKDPSRMAQSLTFLGRLEFSMGNLRQAEAYLQESLMLSQDTMNWRETTSARVFLGQVLFHQERLKEATVVLEQSLRSNRVCNIERDLHCALALHYLGEIALFQDDNYVHAREMIEQSLYISKSNGYNSCLELNYAALALLALRCNDLENAILWLRECLLLQESLKEPWRSAALLEMTAALLAQRSESLGAARLYGIAASLRSSWKLSPMPVYRSLHAACINRLKESLSAQTLEDVWHAGQTLSPDQAITYALRCLE